ncbi:MAG: ADP-ribosylglycohydrolase family protein [Balneolaceae bacterium]|nr:ADP-ribosylglycohydrolase family protein [Saccharospirillum sp.]MCH8550133.1 ADP-ribosylglycohydrolase family protein [Balneolaceae bacterium]
MTQQHIIGALVGLAIGDAMGASVEFKAPGTFEPVTGYRNGGPFNLPPGYWTDDTSLALCSAESLLECNGFNPQDHQERFRRWYREGYLSSTGTCFDIGNQTRHAIHHFETTGNVCVGTESHGSAGNGALMRLAPLVMAYHQYPDHAIALANSHALLTHSDPRCLDANRAFAWFILQAINKHNKHSVLDPRSVLGRVKTTDAEITDILKGSYRERQPPQIKGAGYIVKSLEAALWAFWNSSTFEEGLLMAVNLGDDADTTGAIYGQLAGAFYGLPAIPEPWVHDLHYSEEIVRLANELALNPINPEPIRTRH